MRVEASYVKFYRSFYFSFRSHTIFRMVIESYERNSRNAKESNLTRVRQITAVDGKEIYMYILRARVLLTVSFHKERLCVSLS